MKSTFLSFKTRDFIKAFAMAILSPVVAIIVQTAQNGELTFNWHLIATVAIAAAGGYLIKNFFTDDVSAAQNVIMQAKREQKDQEAKGVNKSFCLLMLLSFAFLCGNSQAFFKPLPRKMQSSRGIGANLISATNDANASFFAFRPLITGAFTLKKNMSESSAMVGTGISYQNLSFNQGTQKYYCNYAISLLAFAGTTPVPTMNVFSPGLMLSALNNQYGLGWRYNDGKGELMATFTVNFNN